MEAGERVAHLDECVFLASASSLFNQDDIKDMLNKAKGKAASVNRTTAETMDKLSAIKKELDKISVAPGDGNLNNVLTDVDQSSEI